jgi:hypothetical protein
MPSKTISKTKGLPVTRTSRRKSKYVVYGEELIEKQVRQSGNTGRIYLPPDWVDHHVKIVRID